MDMFASDRDLLGVFRRKLLTVLNPLIITSPQFLSTLNCLVSSAALGVPDTTKVSSFSLTALISISEAAVQLLAVNSWNKPVVP